MVPLDENCLKVSSAATLPAAVFLSILYVSEWRDSLFSKQMLPFYNYHSDIQLRPDRAGGDSGPSPAPAPPPCLIASTYIYVWLRERGGPWGYTHTSCLMN
jgi:hypothetical protein